MKVQDLLYIPDIAAMVVLMAVLWYLRRQSGAKDVLLWLLGLSFVLLEALAADLYRAKVGMEELWHVIAFVGYVLAGITFAWVAVRERVTTREYLSFCLSGSLPLMAIATMYCLGTRGRESYLIPVLAGAVAQAACMAVFVRGQRNWLFAVAQLVGWAPMVWLAWHGMARALTYWGVGGLYLMVAAVMVLMRERSRIGAAIVVAGFTIWAMCLLAHPFLKELSLATQVMDQIWTLQKFFVTLGLLLVLLDEERKRNEALALNDSLTGLPNRRLLVDRLDQAIERTNRYRIPCAVLMIDLDNFKLINDMLGHAQGDCVLREAARRLLTVVRTSDTLARCGGDEFVIVVNEIADYQNCDLLVAKLREAMQEPSGAYGSSIAASIGYALYPLDTREPGELLALADKQMYVAKTLAKSIASQRPALAVAAPAMTSQSARTA